MGALAGAADSLVGKLVERVDQMSAGDQQIFDLLYRKGLSEAQVSSCTGMAVDAVATARRSMLRALVRGAQ